MSSTQRYVVVGVLTLAIIVAMALSQGSQWLWVQFSWDDPPILGVRELPLSKALVYALVTLTAIFILKHAPTYELLSEIVDELGKVTWPGQAETWKATKMVIITVFLCGAYLGLFDAIWLAVTDWVLGIEPAPGG
jgi:preprotein translocase SecE subunit